MNNIWTLNLDVGFTINHIPADGCSFCHVEILNHLITQLGLSLQFLCCKLSITPPPLLLLFASDSNWHSTCPHFESETQFSRFLEIHQLLCCLVSFAQSILTVAASRDPTAEWRHCTVNCLRDIRYFYRIFSLHFSSTKIVEDYGIFEVWMCVWSSWCLLLHYCGRQLYILNK